MIFLILNIFFHLMIHYINSTNLFIFDFLKIIIYPFSIHSLISEASFFYEIVHLQTMGLEFDLILMWNEYLHIQDKFIIFF